MCTYQTLFHNDECGYVILCRACDSIQVAFGNLLLTWNRPDFYDFFQFVKRMFNESPIDAATIDRKTLAIPVPCDGVRILLSTRELQQLHQMLDMAETELQSQLLMSLLSGE
ncbi:hypothetical protein A4D02_10125 [Niastella koreensis]|uniref:Uncharacterized protein n=2 Tax=Niastella koreensis TaxID=354356 RepID=G8TPR5_NIAKG|nr:DUF6686 family protein [Niastella koreensis]AEV98898.1 hypothetical protein Niako_2558 [Niastella koreensis GR20-10]OQP43826.1 hypothetical protein A4D02_10125 [Niastella koreensis]